jgi:hypothetical protein
MEKYYESIKMADICNHCRRIQWASLGVSWRFGTWFDGVTGAFEDMVFNLFVVEI